MRISEELLQKIRENDPTLTSLDLGGNQIGPAEAQALATALKTNITLKSLNLYDNKIGPAGALAIATALKTNTTLTSLNLGSNQIGTAGAIAIATALKANTTLTSLDLGNNQIGPVGAQAIATELKTNKTLTSLDLYYNDIGTVGAQALATALENHPTLTSLDIDGNQILSAGVKAIVIAFQNNPTLTILNIEGNQIEPEEQNAIEAITQRNRSMIPEISGVMSRIISQAPNKRLSDLQIRFVSNKYCPENCVIILENLLINVPNDDIKDVLQRVQDMPGAIGAMILFTAFKAQEIDLPQNKLDLPEDRLKLVKDALMEMELTSLFKAKGVIKKEVIGGLLDESGSIKLNANTKNHILGYLERDDIKKTPSTTVLHPSSPIIQKDFTLQAKA